MENSSDGLSRTDEFIFATGSARENRSLADMFCQLLEKLSSTEDRHNIYLPDVEDLTKWDAVVAAWIHEERAVAGLYILGREPGRYYLGGVVSDIKYRKRGLTRSLVRYAIESLTNIGSCIVELDVRIKFGRLNYLAYKLFAANGFETVDIKSHELGANKYEQHLYESIESEGCIIRSVRMQLKLGEISKELAA